MDHGRIYFSDDRKNVVVYVKRPVAKDGKFARSNYLHPILDLNGNEITEDFPADHLHHRGIFWAWHQVIVGKQKAGDGWLTKDFISDVEKTEVVYRKDGSASLIAKTKWLSPLIKIDRNALQTIINEKTTITIYPISAQTRIIDFDIELLAAAADVSIGGSDDAKGYGGFSARVRLPDDVVFRGHHGEVKPQQTAIDAGPWIDIVGSFSENQKQNAKTNSDEKIVKDPSCKSGVAIFVHPSSAGYPQKWILRSQDSMQNAVYPGRKPVAVSQTRPTVLRYRILLHQNELTVKQMQMYFDQYKKMYAKKTEAKNKDHQK